MTHICVVKLTIIGSDNGLTPGRRQAIIWTSAGILLIGPLETNFIEIPIVIQTFLFKKMHLKMSSAKWRPFCLGLNVLTWLGWVTHSCVNEQQFQMHFIQCKYQVLIKTYHWDFFLHAKSTMSQHWFIKWLVAPSHYLNQWWPGLLTQICVIRP